jgi:hypothetical protein
MLPKYYKKISVCVQYILQKNYKKLAVCGGPPSPAPDGTQTGVLPNKQAGLPGTDFAKARIMPANLARNLLRQDLCQPSDLVSERLLGRALLAK